MKQNHLKSSRRLRAKTVSFRATEAEFNEISSAIKRSGLSRQEYLLTGARGKTIYVIEDLKPIHHELKALVAQFNMQTILAQQGLIDTIDTTDVIKALEKAYVAINGVYSNLDGTIASGNVGGNIHGNV